jgi:hypothetical protein
MVPHPRLRQRIGRPGGAMIITVQDAERAGSPSLTFAGFVQEGRQP